MSKECLGKKRYPYNGLRMARIMKGISQDELAISAEIDQSLVSRIERGVTGSTERVREKIAEFLDIPVRAIFPETEHEKEGKK